MEIGAILKPEKEKSPEVLSDAGMRIAEKCLPEVRLRIRSKVLAEMSEEEQREACLQVIEETVFEFGKELSIYEATHVIQLLYYKTREWLGVLTPLVQNQDIQEIMVNGTDHIFVERRDGIHELSFGFGDTEELEECIRRIAASVHREINEMNPILDARLPDGSRVNAVYKNVAVDGPVLTIRKFSSGRLTARDMIALGTMPEECARDLNTLVKSGYNIFVSGGTSTGKTTFLNALTDYIQPDERVIVIEDSQELALSQIRNLVQMECRQANSVGKGRVSMDDLIRTSLRMRPDRIIVGEVRGVEVASMLQALNTGHSGLSTGHGNSVRGMLRRFEAMYLMAAQIPMDSIRAQITEAIDVMVHLVRLPDGRRIVSEVQELISYRDGEYVLNPLYVLSRECVLVRTESRLLRREKLIMGGMDEADDLIQTE